MKVINTFVSEKVLVSGDKKFRYSFIKVLLVIFLFPFVYVNSKKYQKLFLRFCFSYQRNGNVKIKEQESVDINSFDYHYYDCQLKQLNRYGYPIKFNLENYHEFVVKNDNGQDISCLTVIHKEPTTKWVIGFHGWTENKYLALRMVSWFYQQGYNILTFDSMAHGKSYGQHSDIGLTSSQDVNCLVNWLKENYQVTSIGLIGNSMGATTINYYLLNYAPAKAISWAIVDCGFTNLLMQCRFVMQYRFKKPWWLISNGLNKRYKKFTGTNISEYNVMKKLKKGFNVPTLLIHGKEDEIVPFFMANKVHKYQKKNNYKNYDYLFLDNIGHVETLPNAYEIYIKKVKDFININEINK